MVSFQIIVLWLVIPGALSVCKSGLDGREFFFGIIQTSMYNYYDHDAPSNDTVELHVTNASPNYTRMRLQIPFTNTDTYYDIPPDQSRTISVSSRIQKLGTYHEMRGIRISSDNDINVLVTSVKSGQYQLAIESYTVLPTRSVGKRYFISPGTGRFYFRYDLQHTVLITSAYDNNQVRLYNTTTGLVNKTFLNRLEVYQYHNFQTFAGLLIEAEQEISVVSGLDLGNGYYYSSVNNEATTYSVIPTKHWSKMYIVPRLLSANTVEIKTKSEYVSLRMNISTLTQSTVSMAKIQTYENTTVVLTAENPFSVLQKSVFFNSSRDNFMVVVPGLDQYMNDYRFTVPHLRSNITNSDLYLTNNVAVIIPRHFKDRLLVDGTPVPNMGHLVEEYPVPAPFDNYTVLCFQISKGHHRIRHLDSHVTFGLLVYGSGNDYNNFGYGQREDQRYYWSSTASTDGSSTRYIRIYPTTASPYYRTTTQAPQRYSYSYGFYGGFDLDGGKCTQTVTEGTTYSLPNVFPTSSNTNAPVSLFPLNLSQSLCSSTSKNMFQNMCFIERQNKSGRILYRSGCLSADLCTSQHHESLSKPELCVECCNGSFCNNKGCGGTGVPTRDRRGPLCYDCQHVSSPHKCSAVTLCSHNQICRIEKFTWGENFHYKMGYANKLCDPLTRGVHHLTKRATPVCCNDDFCNNNCTRSNAGPTLVG